VALTGKWVIWAVEGNAPWQVLVHHQIQHAHHIGGIKGPFQLCDIIGNVKAFVIPGSFLSWQFEGPRDAWDLASQPIWTFHCQGVSLGSLQGMPVKGWLRKAYFFGRTYGIQTLSNGIRGGLLTVLKSFLVWTRLF
jgi:hypothetical protein